jgi:hypothetical protein
MSSNYMKFPGPDKDAEEAKPLLVSPSRGGAGPSGYGYDVYQAPAQSSVTPTLGYPSAGAHHIQPLQLEPQSLR